MTQKYSKVDFDCGTLLAIPLETGGYGCGMIARIWPRTFRSINSILLYGFNARYTSLPAFEDIKNKTIKDVIVFVGGSDMFVCNGRWKVIGKVRDFKEDSWPVPVTCHEDHIVISNPEGFDDVVVENDGYIRKQDFKHLPPIHGVGGRYQFENLLDEATKLSQSSRVFRVSDRTLEVWESSTKRIAKDGLIPWLDESGKRNKRVSPGLMKARKIQRIREKKYAVSGKAKNAPRDTPMMTVDQFWKTIDEIKKKSKNNIDTLSQNVNHAMSKLSLHELTDFRYLLHHFMAHSNTWKLWGAAYTMSGGCSEEGFEYWRCWLVLQGRKAFEAASLDPESLATHRLAFVNGDMYGFESWKYEFEPVMMAPEEKYEEKSKTPMGASKIKLSQRRAGKEWEERDMRERLPRLWKKFSDV